MNDIHRYRANDKMCNLICGNYSLISAISRFGIPFGFGEKTVKEVCEQNGVDCNTFLAVVNFMEEGQYGYEYETDTQQLSLHALVSYLKQAHNYFLDFYLPLIKSKLTEALKDDTDNTAVTKSILMFFNEYEAEVRKHMEYENKFVFEYVENLLAGKISDSYRIKKFAQKHNHIEQNLTELKNIIIKYYPQSVCNNLLNATLFDIFNCESDLNLHCKLEDDMFTPAVANLEKKLLNE